MNTYAPVLSMPNELWDLTLSHLDMVDILNLSTTHRIFQHSARRKLYERVCIPLQRDKDAQNFGHLQQFFELSSGSAAFRLYLRELRLEYTLGSGIKGMYIPCYGYPCAKELEAHHREILWIKNRTIQKLIASLPSLKTVTVYIQGEPCDNDQIEVTFFRLLCVILHDCPVRIRVLCDRVYDMPMRELFKIPQATSLAFDAPIVRIFGEDNGYRISDAVVFANIHPGNHMYNITSLDLGYNVIDIPQHLQKIIQQCPKVLDLNLWLESSAFPEQFTRALLAVKDTLRVLRVHRGISCFPDDLKHGTFRPADFSAFTALRELHIDSSTLIKPLLCSGYDILAKGFVWYPNQSDRTVLCANLPPHLDSLDIAFDWPNSIFATGESYHSHFKTLPESVKEKGFAWMDGLLKMSIPKVVLWETGHECQTWGRAAGRKLTGEMKLPEMVQEKCVKAGVRLQVWLLESSNKGGQRVRFF